jgi:mxaK protein
MESLMKRLLNPWLLRMALGLMLAGTAHAMHLMIQINEVNAELESPEQIVLTDDSSPELIFARAHWLETQDPLEAIRLYGSILQRSPPDLMARIRYNLGSLYLKDAAKIWKKNGLSEYIRINTLLGAAKDNLRESLTLDPSNWQARFNLEYAERITPPPRERPKNDFQGNKGSVFATLPTIPGGGP